jgi:hypothetical protein
VNRRPLLESALIFGVVAVTLAWLIYRFEAGILDGFVPLFRAEIKLLMPEFRLDDLDWKHERSETVIALTATLSDYRVVLGRVLPPGVSLNASTLAAHAWVHPVLMLSLLAAWPGIAWRRKPLLLLTGIPFVFVAELLDVPLMLWGAVEDVLYWGVDPARAGESFGSAVQHFLDGGGRYALSVLLALAAVGLFRRLQSRQSEAS